MQIMVVRNPEFVFDVGVVRATSEGEALELARDWYDLWEESLKVCALHDLPESEVADVLRFSLVNVKGYIPTVDLKELTRTLSPEQAISALADLADWVVQGGGSHPWLRSRTEYDDRAEQEASYWMKELRIDERDLDIEKLPVLRSIRREVLDRYEAARLSGQAVPSEYVVPPALAAYREQTRPLFVKLRERKSQGCELEMTREALQTLLDKEHRSLFETAQLFGTSIRHVCESLPQERRGRRRDPVQLVPREVSNCFEQLVYEVDLAQVEQELQAMETEAIYIIPVSTRINARFSIYRSNYGLDVVSAFERLIEEMSELNGMCAHQLGQKSSWKPREAAMLELRKWAGPTNKDLERVRLREILDEIKGAIALLQSRMQDGEHVADGYSFDRLRNALSEAADILEDRIETEG